MKTFVTLAVLGLVAPLFVASGEDRTAPTVSAPAVSDLSAALPAPGPSGCPADDTLDAQNDGNFGCDAPSQCHPRSHPQPHYLQLGVQVFGVFAPPVDVVDMWAWFPSDPGTAAIVQMTPAPDFPEAARKHAPGPDFDLFALDHECRPLPGPGCESRHPGAQVETLQCFVPPEIPWLVIVVEPKPALVTVPPPGLTPTPDGSRSTANVYCDPVCTTFGYSAIALA